jgi:signal recognition particle receptor subunit alpha
VAREAVKYGTENGFDCVLIDTAGRMQNNESLMRALAKLVSSNDPDLVLFVGEALVGNDGIDQLVMFDRVRNLCGAADHRALVLTIFCATLGACGLLRPP